MWERLPAFIREWSILIVGILLIVPFLYLSSYEASSSKSTASAPSLSQKDQAVAGSAADASGPSAQPSSHPAPTPMKTAQDSANAPAKAPVMSHDHMAAAPAAQTSGQGASAPAAAVAPVSGD